MNCIYCGGRLLYTGSSNIGSCYLVNFQCHNCGKGQQTIMEGFETAKIQTELGKYGKD